MAVLLETPGFTVGVHGVLLVGVFLEQILGSIGFLILRVLSPCLLLQGPLQLKNLLHVHVFLPYFPTILILGMKEGQVILIRQHFLIDGLGELRGLCHLILQFL